MKMTPQWMRETSEMLQEWGFACEVTTEPRELEGRVIFERTRYVLKRSEHEELVLECLEYTDGSVRYWAEVVAWHGLTCDPYLLDSWRHRDTRVEFKYQVDPDAGTGLAFVIHKDRLS